MEMERGDKVVFMRDGKVLRTVRPNDDSSSGKMLVLFVLLATLMGYIAFLAFRLGQMFPG